MDPETKQTATLLLGEIARAKSYSQMPQPHELFLSAETIISSMAYLITPMLHFEDQYRKEIVTFMASGDSNAKATAKAQAGENYKNFKHIKYIYDLADSQTMMLKRFHNVLQDEYRRS